MRILVFSTAYYPFVGGAEVAVKEIAERLPSHDWVLITTRLSRTVARYEKIGNIQVYRVGFGHSLDKFLLPITGLFKAYILNYQKKVDLIWSMMASQASVAAVFYKKLHPSTPLVLSLQEGDEEEHLKRYVGGNDTLFRYFVLPWHRMVIRSANRITAISRYLRDRAVVAGAKVQPVIVPNGVDLAFYSPGDEKKPVTDKVVLITTSRLVEKNAVGDVISALPLLPDNVVFKIIGYGALEATLRAQVRTLGLESRVEFLGNPGHTFNRDQLREADIFIRPSLSEGLGISFLEAMACRLPVVATSVGGIKDFLIDGETGIECEPKNPSSIATAVKRLLDNQFLSKRIAENGYHLAHERYGWDAIVPAMAREFEKPITTTPTLLIATGIYPPDIGGPASYAKGLYDTLALTAPRTQVLTYGIEKKLPTGVRHLVTFFKLLIALPFVDAVIALDTFSVGLPAVLAARLMRKKVIVRIGGDFLWEQYVNRTHEDVVLSEFYSRHRQFTGKERAIAACTGFVLRNASALVFTTAWQKGFMLPAYGVRDDMPVTIIENCEGERIPSKEASKKNFLWAGRPIFLKNTVRMRLAFEKARRINPDIFLDIVENVPHDELLERMRSAYAIMLPSISEVSPNLLLEAIAVGKPFVATRESGYAERFKDLGLLFDPLSIDDIAEQMLAMADDMTYATYLRKVRDYSYTHTYQDIAQEWIAFYRSLSVIPVKTG